MQKYAFLSKRGNKKNKNDFMTLYQNNYLFIKKQKNEKILFSCVVVCHNNC